MALIEFWRDKKFLVLDFETYSDLSLGDHGAYEYSMHASTDIICVAFAIGTLKDFRRGTFEVHTWTPLYRERNLKSFALLHAALQVKGTTIVAHNAFFDALILKNVFIPRYAHSLMRLRATHLGWPRFFCTSAQALSVSLPRSLGGAAEALKLDEGKDKAGNRLVKKWSRPRQPTRTDGALRHLDLVQRPGTDGVNARLELKRIIDYCKSDIRVTVNLLLKLPPLDEREKKLWDLTQTVNERGFAVDRPLVQKVLAMLSHEGARLDTAVRTLTDGQVESALKTEALKRWCNEHGLETKSVDKAHVAAALASDGTPSMVKRVLRIRQARAMSSTAKYERFEAITRTDGRARGGLVYHAASTGRWAGALLNPQNFPRGSITNSIKELPAGAAVLQATELLATGDIDLLRMVYGSPMKVFSSCLRAMIVPSEGHVFDVADYAQIEVRVLFWMAEHKAGLEVFSDKKRDIYCEAASQIFGVPVESVGKDSWERFVGKEQILGCGYQMGWQKFQKTMADKGRPISEDLSRLVIDVYRRRNKPVQKMWWDLEGAAIKAALTPGAEVSTRGCTFLLDGEFLYCTLPSGRRLAYHEPLVKYESRFGEKKHVLYYWTVSSTSRKRVHTSTYGGKLTENVVQATARDIMANAKLAIEGSGVWKLVLSVHDEIIAERPIFSEKSLDDFIALMKKLPAWAKGCPIEAAGWTGKRYRK